MARVLGLETVGGALIAQVMPQSAAAAAGLQPRDVIAALDGEKVPDAAALRNLISLQSPEQPVTLEIIRDGKRIPVKVVLRQANRAMERQRPETVGAEQLHRLQGLSLTEDQGGITVAGVAPMSGAARAGLLVGDRIVAVANTPVSRLDQLRDAIAAAPPDKPVLIEVQRQGTPFFLALP
jgi:S1-C subfamily serine protease